MINDFIVFSTEVLLFGAVAVILVNTIVRRRLLPEKNPVREAAAWISTSIAAAMIFLLFLLMVAG